ncbi:MULTISPECIES: hypothetical protein [Acinetobacter calcoaceticus/baumannii complex]|uniref:hypothetical protein n=1 Tax=Acinetobacter calcoaceticus/baumannii complex TaxID=909768 RepID=UPI00031AEC73|nr:MULTISPECIES: hypothetical protein [Acinetobacter calcoaceticus/baumannii complex]MCJ9074279.1 hypothetical protein [Acinetobacter baumannii]MCJ9563211.1 hypothetical protein [Acinetobacter baumannii]SSQ25070.1 Uncharacterised protein [Acinetobacter baumannii]HCQ9935384.1 hypothetical protein [Acinetobacter baumannii]
MKIMPIVFFVLFVGCSKSETWICKSGVNANGDAIQYSENAETGEIGAYSKCQNKAP